MTRRLRRLEPLDPEGEGRRKSNQTTVRTVDTVREPQRRGKDRNPTLTETSWKCDSSQNPRLRRGATGVVGRGGAADPHGCTERSGVNSIRPTSGRSRGSTFACDGTARFGTCGQDVEAAGLVPRGTSPVWELLLRGPVRSPKILHGRAMQEFLHRLYRNDKLYRIQRRCMAKTVKARVHHGADSLDLTIPADVVREFDLNSGDIFEVDVSDGESLEIKYERVYESE